MHYFKFNVSDWQAATRHLTPEEEGVYIRLINYYYDSERPIPLETQTVIRRLMLGSYAVIVQSILDEFFVRTERGYEKEKCNEIIKEYKKTSSKNKRNGALGGRPKKVAACRETQSVISGFAGETQDKPKHNPNQEPRTKNQEPETIEKKPEVEWVKIKGLYNEILGPYVGMVRALTDQRKKSITARIKEDPDKRFSSEWWGRYFTLISERDFLMGRSGDNPKTGKPWKIDFDWVINPNNMVKILEGKYDE